MHTCSAILGKGCLPALCMIWRLSAKYVIRVVRYCMVRRPCNVTAVVRNSTDQPGIFTGRNTLGYIFAVRSAGRDLLKRIVSTSHPECSDRSSHILAISVNYRFCGRTVWKTICIPIQVKSLFSVCTVQRVRDKRLPTETWQNSHWQKNICMWWLWTEFCLS